MLETSIAAKADYADAILVARRAKNWLFLILLIVLIGEIAIFFVARKTSALNPYFSIVTTDQPAPRLLNWLKYLVALAGYIGVAGSLLFSGIVLLLVKIMLTSRTLGVAKITSAFIWSLLLIVLLFPWQAVLNNPTLSAMPDPMVADFKIPGVIYTWSELTHPTLGAKFDSPKMQDNILRWARFVGFPVLAVMILMSTQVKSSMGIKAALGEDQARPSDAANI